MKRIIYVITICLFGQYANAQCGGSGQPPCNPGFFEIQMVQLSLSQIEIQMRAVSSVVPQQSSCAGVPATIQNNVVSDLTFAVKWPTGDPVLLLFPQTVTPCTCNPGVGPGTCSGGSGGYSEGLGIGPIDGLDGTMIQGFGITQSPYGIPDNWVLDQWVAICTLDVFFEAAPVPVNFMVYALGDNSPAEVGAAIAPNFTFDETDYTMAVQAILPLNLISFSAQKYGERSAIMNWVTADEINTSHFVVERSVDRYNWQVAGKVQAAGESVATRKYQFIDEDVYDGRRPNVRYYYRLNMVDSDGRARISNIDVVQFSTNLSAASVYVFPNPSTNGVNVELNYTEENSAPAEMLIYNGLGQLVYSKEVPEGSTFEFIDFAKTNIFSGTYTLQVMDQTNGILATEKFIVQR